jgi:ornithine cyclodeaminase/alanine dehydrogenase-like protein (mu-crystallin family)
MSGVVLSLGVGAVRTDSDLLRWPEINGAQRRVKLTTAQDSRVPIGKENGTVFLYSLETGAMLAIIQDGDIQRLRVGGTSGLGVKHLARKNAKIAGILGSGWQAEAQLLSLLVAREITEIKVYSPNPSHREEFAGRMGDKTGVCIRPVASAEEATRNSDVVLISTNSKSPVIRADWLQPGTHVGFIIRLEVDEAVMDRADVLATNVKDWAATKTYNYLVGGIKPEDIAEEDFVPGWWQHDSYWKKMRHLGGIIAGDVAGRTQEEQITCFYSKGMGLQFAAVGALAYKLAKEQGVGIELNDEWFLQDYYQK